MKLKTLFFLCIVFSLYTCCKDDDDDCIDPKNPKCSNYDPCYGAQEVNADFRMIEIIGHGDANDTVMVETDTVFTLNMVQFEPKQEQYDSVTWLIGSETLHEHSVARKSFPVYKTVPITLIVYRKPNTSCFPEDDGRDTVTKLITGMPYDDLPIRGKYKGYNIDDPSNLFTISVHDTMYCRPKEIRTGRLKNLPNGIPRNDGTPCTLPYAAGYGGKAFFLPRGVMDDDSYFNTPSLYCGMRAKGVLNAKGELSIEYEYDEIGFSNALNGVMEHSPAKTVTKTFIGKKL